MIQKGDHMNSRKKSKTLSTSLFFIAILALTTGRAAYAKIPEGSSANTTSQYQHNQTKIDGFNIEKYTDSPLQVVVMAHVKAPPEKTFDLVARDFPAWFEGIPSIEWDHAKSAHKNTYGEGTIRKCQFNSDLLVENINYWDECRMYSYSALMDQSTVSMPVYDHLGVFIVESDTQGGSIITWRQYFKKKFHIMSPMMTWYMRTKMMEPNLQNIVDKYGGTLIEPKI